MRIFFAFIFILLFTGVAHPEKVVFTGENPEMGNFCLHIEEFESAIILCCDGPDAELEENETSDNEHAVLWSRNSLSFAGCNIFVPKLQEAKCFTSFSIPIIYTNLPPPMEG